MDEVINDNTINEDASVTNQTDSVQTETGSTTDQNTPQNDTAVDSKANNTTVDTNTVTEDISLTGLKYEGQDVTVNIPADLANAVAEKGIDAEAITKELYSPEGLSQETRDALNEAFGKWQVDAYLKGLDALNRENIAQFKTETENNAKAQETAWNETLEIMGGEDRWADLDSFATNTLSQEDLDEFNAVMKDGTLKMQKLMIHDLWNQFESAGKPEPTASLDLEKGENIPVSDTKSAISQAEYFEAFQNGEYRKDAQAWDARRKAGMLKGI